MALGEEKAVLLHEALADLVAKLKGGLNPIFYRDVPFLPLYIAAGSTVHFGVVMPDGEVSRENTIWTMCDRLLPLNATITIVFTTWFSSHGFHHMVFTTGRPS